MKAKRILTAFLLSAMALTELPSVYAEEPVPSASPVTETESQNNSNSESSGSQTVIETVPVETIEIPPEETPVPSETPVATEQPSATEIPVAETPVPSQPAESDPEPSVTPSAPTVETVETEDEMTREEILSLTGGDEERADLIENIQAYIDDEIAKDPHFTLMVSGSGTVEITDSDGVVTAYRWDETEIRNGEDEGKKSDDTKFTFPIYGEEGDVYHIRTIPDDQESTLKFDVTEYETAVKGTTENLVAKKQEENQNNDPVTELEYDVTMKADHYTEIAVSFSEVYTQQMSPSDLAEEDKGVVETLIDAVLNPTEAHAAGETVNITGWCSPSAGGYGYLYNDRFNLNSSNDPVLQSYITAYRNQTGSAPVVICQNHGDYPPKDGSYTFTYSTRTRADGWIEVSISLNTRVLASSVWGNNSYFNSHPYIQAASGTFAIPPQVRNVAVELTKVSDNPAVTNAYPDYYSLAGAVYGIYTDAGCTQQIGTMTTNANGKASATLSVSTAYNTLYTKELTAPKGFNLDGNVRSAAISNGRSSFTSYESVTQIEQFVLKTDENGTPIAGAQLALYKQSGELVTAWESTGDAKALYLDPGHYVLKETSAPAGYYIADPVEFEVVPGVSGQTYTMNDKPIKYAVEKIDKDTGEPLAGVTLELRNIYGQVVDQWVTDGTPHNIPKEVLEQGKTYRIRETATVPGHYHLDKEIEFTVGSQTDEAITITVDNPVIHYGALKKDAVTGVFLSGVNLQLKDSSGMVLDEWTTDGNIHEFDPEILNAGETYYIHEVGTIDGYYRNPTDVKFTIPKNVVVAGVVEVSMENWPIRYAIDKIDKDTDKRLPGVTLAVYDSEDNEIERWTSSESGPHNISAKLKTGETYQVRELETVNGYYLNDSVEEFTVSETSSSSTQQNVITVTFENTSIDFYVIKRDKETKENIAGVELQLFNSSGDLVHTFVSSNLTVSGYHIPSQYLVAGETYTVRESKPINGYYYAEDVQFTVPRTLSEAKASKNKFTIIMYDEPIEYEFVKRNADTNEQMKGMQLGIREWNDDGTPGNIIITWETDGKPYKADSSYLVAGKTYSLEEIGTVQGYFKPSPVKFTIPEHGTMDTVTVTILNTPMSWKIIKQDTDGNILTTSGGTAFVLEVYDANGTTDNTADDILVKTLSTDDEAYIANGYFELGSDLDSSKIYRIHEAHAANGYRYADDTYVDFTQITGNVETIITDERMDIRLEKVDQDDNILTHYTYQNANQSFKLAIIDDETGETVCTVDTTDDAYIENGYADITEYVAYGKSYTIHETEFPYGYYRANDFSFTLDDATLANGTVEIKMIDPVMRVKFRKEDMDGNVLTTIDGESFRFTVYDTMGTQDDTSDDIAVTKIDTAEAGTDGCVQIGQYLKENTTYRIHETYSPQGWLLADDVFFTTPAYYVGN